MVRAGQRALRLATAIDHDHIDRPRRPLLGIEVAGHSEVIHNIVLVIQHSIEIVAASPARGIPHIQAAIAFGTLFRVFGLHAANNQNSLAIVGHCLKCIERNGMVDLGCGQIANLENFRCSTILHRSEGRVHDDGLDVLE